MADYLGISGCFFQGCQQESGSAHFQVRVMFVGRQSRILTVKPGQSIFCKHFVRACMCQYKDRIQTATIARMGNRGPINDKIADQAQLEECPSIS